MQKIAKHKYVVAIYSAIRSSFLQLKWSCHESHLYLSATVAP